jgi:hypothetical protein
VRDGRNETIRSRWRQDKGHQAEWAAFVQFAEHRAGAPIPFEDIVCTTLATLRINESVASGKRLAVDTVAFIEAALETAGGNPSLNE